MISVISLFPFIGRGVSVGEDISDQVKSSVQWINGKTIAPNMVSVPDKLDLSVNNCNWSPRPPAVAILPTIGMLFDLPLGYSIQVVLLICSILGGIGWLHLFKVFEINKSIIFLISIMLGLNTGDSSFLFGTANIILYAIVPWFILYILRFHWNTKRPQSYLKSFIQLAVFLFLLGCFAWIKLSGLIVAGTIGASMYFILLNQLSYSQKKQFTLLYGVLGISFWIPFFLLEKTNLSLLGLSANEVYARIVNYEIENRLFGHHWCESSQNLWLIWSFIAALGYSLPIKVISHGFRDFFIQFEEFTTWTFQNSINEHVLLCGLIGIIFSIIIIFKLIASSQNLNSEHRTLIGCFFILPFVGLAILSFKYEWNYLLYHAHTSEFWIIFCIPIFIAFSNEKKTRLSTIMSLGIIIALPITETLSKLIQKLSTDKYTYISTTEKERGLTSSRFSQAIDYIENDSDNSLDIIYFLPQGDTGDLVLRTKMRNMATHFASYNFPQHSHFKTSKELSVYLVYDKKLAEIPEFLKATNEKFLNAISGETILKGSIIVKKIKLNPDLSVS